MIKTYLGGPMNASILDLRYKTKSLLKALEKCEKINILYHGKIKGIILPFQEKDKKLKVSDHEYFGSLKDARPEVEEVMQKLRGGRYAL